MEKRGRLKKVGTSMEKRGGALEKVGILDGIEKRGRDGIEKSGRGRGIEKSC